ncbi:MAG: hypothetical protein V1676_02115 [Candidatus Diapherotrites archaeon]
MRERRGKRKGIVMAKGGKKVVELLDGNTAAAHAAVLSRVECMPCFPITPQTEMIHVLSEWKAEGRFKAQFKVMDSEHSAMSAAIGAEMAGARTFTSTSSQGLLLMLEELYIASGTRMPVVMVNGSRAVSAPITLWCDHNDLMATRDSGWLITVSENNQELLDNVIISFRVGESKKIMLPSIVNMDGFVQSYTRYEVEIPSQKTVDRFLPKYKPQTILDPRNPMSLGTPAMPQYMDFRAQMHRAQLDALGEMKRAYAGWAKLTGRKYDVVERYKLADAKEAIIIIGSNALTAKTAVDELRAKGKKVGLLRLRVLRPFPRDEIAAALRGVKKVAVVDQSVAPGAGGILYPEVRAALAGSGAKVSSYIAGLGGRWVEVKDYAEIFRQIRNAGKELRRWVM